eukprot:1158835-Pelagomonas_calceolata.AAC.9
MDEQASMPLFHGQPQVLPGLWGFSIQGPSVLMSLCVQVSAQEAQARLAAALAAAEAEQQEGARAVREAQAQAKQQFNLQPFPQPETSLLCLFYFSAQPEVRGNPEQHERDDVRLAQLQQQLQQQQALAKREVRVAMVALEEAEAKAECQVEQLATTIQCAVARSTMAGWIIAFSELEALRCCLKDESDVRQRAEAMLAEREQEYSAQVQAAEEAEAKSRLLADAVAQWQVRGVVHDCVCLQLMLASSSRPRIENMFAAGGQEAQSPLCCSHV